MSHPRALERERAAPASRSRPQADNLTTSPFAVTFVKAVDHPPSCAVPLSVHRETTYSWVRRAPSERKDGAAHNAVDGRINCLEHRPLHLRPYSLLSITLSLTLLLVPVVASAERPTPSAGRAAPSLQEPSELTEQDMLFAHHRMSGTEPDFRALAEAIVAARPPSASPVRNEAAERRYLVTLTTRRLRATFESFSLDQPRTIKAEVDILGYDRARGGIPLRFGALSGLLLRDPSDRERSFSLRFRNTRDIGVIPTGDADEAADLLQNADLASLGDWAGSGTLTVTFVFAEALPQAKEIEAAPLSAEILSARVETASGELLHVFDPVGSRQAAAAARLAGPPTLRVASLSGLRIGMPLLEARAEALRSHPEPLGQAFFDSLPDAIQRGLGHPDCSAGVVADMRAFNVPLTPGNFYRACVAPTAAGPEDPLAGLVVEVAEVRFLPGAKLEEIRSDLEARFGPPLEELADGQLVWIGQDPADGSSNELLELRATFINVAQGGPQREPGVLSALTLRRHEKPSADDS